MMEVENRIETFGGQVDELPDELKDRRVNGNHANGNGVILEESEEEDLGDSVGVMEKTPVDASQAIAGRVIKKVCDIMICVYCISVHTIVHVAVVQLSILSNTCIR